jgi:hypothetical protein
MAGKDWNLNIKRTTLTLDCGSAAYQNFGRPEANFASISLAGPWPFPYLFFFGVLWIGDAVVLSASICRSFFKGPLALALGMHGCEATEVTYITA